MTHSDAEKSIYEVVREAERERIARLVETDAEIYDRLALDVTTALDRDVEASEAETLARVFRELAQRIRSGE